MAEVGQSKLSFAVVGTGALGGYYGFRLVRAGYPVHFLCRSDGAYIRQHGLTVTSGGERVTRQVMAYDRSADMPQVEVVLVCLKTTENHRLRELLPPMLKPSSLVVMLQNGLEEEAKAAAVVGADRVIGGLCFLCANKVGPGHVVHLDYGRIVLGQYTPEGRPGGVTPGMKQLASAFVAAGIQATGTDCLRLARWEKLVWNIPYNGLSVLLGAETDVLMACAPVRHQIEVIMEEVRSLAAADGHHIPETFPARMLMDTERMKPYKTSMMLDYERGNPMEISALYRDPLAAGLRGGAAAPCIAQIEAMLSLLDQRNRKR
ncbi:MAG: putative 2-dehydropantoate 2-reductase [Kiritimatiellae bacterium]|nr:putative 2-dehydropantoate 2-reductase [Kiritimatiellia bacterium]